MIRLVGLERLSIRKMPAGCSMAITNGLQQGDSIMSWHRNLATLNHSDNVIIRPGQRQHKKKGGGVYGPGKWRLILIRSGI